MLFRKMLRDIKIHKMQFISILLMTFLGVFVYTGIGGEWIGMQKTLNKYYDDTKLADVWLIGKDFSEDNLKSVKAIDSVTEVQRRLKVETIGSFSNNPTIVLNFVEENNISLPYIKNGEKFSDDKDGIWIDDGFANAKKLKIGDDITVTLNGITLTKTIKGTIVHPEYVYYKSDSDIVPNYNNSGYAFLSIKVLPKEIPITYNELLFKTNNKNPDKLEDTVSKALNGGFGAYISRKNLESDLMIRNEINQHKAIGSVFPVAFLAIALLTILTTMSRIVTNQRTQIGTLKSLGFKNRKILFHYVSYGLWLSLAGAFLGAIIGPLTLPNLFYPSMSKFYMLPEWKPTLSISFYIMAAACVLVSTLTTFIACRKVLQDTAAQTLRPKSPKAIKSTRLSETNFWKKLGFNAQWNFRDVFRSKIRSIMAIVGVVGCTALLVCSFGFNDSMKDLKKWQYNDINKFQTLVNIDKSATDEQILDIKNSINGEAYMDTPVEIKFDGKKKTTMLTVSDNVTLIKTTDENRNYIDLPRDGLSMSYKFAETIGAKKGDKITWHLYGDEKWITSEIKQIYRTPSEQGIAMSKELFSELGLPFKATAIVTSENTSKNFEGASSVWSASEFTKSWDDMTNAMNVMIYSLIVAACLLAIVVLYNLGLMSFTEKERELATLKVIGFKSSKIRNLLLTQNIWLTIVGILIGIPCGKLMIDFMISTIGEGFDMMTIISASNIIISTVITLGLSIVVNLMFSKKIRRVDMVSSLKGVE